MYGYTISAAYGRSYRSRKAATADFLAGLDFIMHPAGCYCSIRDIPVGAEVSIRYDQMRKVFPLVITEAMKAPPAPAAEPQAIPGSIGAVLEHKRSRHAKSPS